MSASTFSLHIGVNRVDTNHYKGWNGELHGCENDALFYHQLAQKEGCSFSKLLLTSDPDNAPTSTGVLAFLDHSIQELKPGDNLIITYSGHGGTLEDKNFDEPDFQDETWCLFDRQLLDDELFLRFSRFQPGVNIFVISDSCHSGSIVKGDTTEATPAAAMQNRIPRFVPRDKLFDTFQANRSIYEPFMRLPIVREEEIPAAVLQLGACQDNEYAMEDGGNGLFTKTIMRILERNAEISSYKELLIRSKRALTGIQQPNLLSYGKNHLQLVNQKPFGSAYHEGTSTRIDIFDDKGSLIIEATNATLRLDSFPEFKVSQAVPVPGKDGFVRYHCTCTLDEPGMYPWDHAYGRYRWLKEKSFPVCSMEPDATERLPADNIFTTNEMAMFLCGLFKGKVKEIRGLGKTERPEEDEVMLNMIALETIYVMHREPEMKAYLDMDAAGFQSTLNNAEEYKKFVTLLKDSIFSSDTLTVHL